MIRRIQGFRCARLIVALVAVVGLGLSGRGEARERVQWVSAWGFSQQGLTADTETVTNGTVRMIARPTVSGAFVRVRIDNTFGLAPLTIGAAYIALRNNGAQLVPGSSRQLTFGGSTSATIAAGDGISADPLPFAVRAWEDVAVSLYVPGTSVRISRHSNARTTSYVTAANAGNAAANETAVPFTGTTTAMYWVSAIDVLSAASGTVVFFGDSITDGTGTTTDGHDRWHDVWFLRRLFSAKTKDQLAAVNEGIGGNRVNTRTGANSPVAVDRLDRDVLARSGVTHVVLFEGTNDLASGLATSDSVMTGIREIVARVKARGFKMIGVTIIPRHNATWTPLMTQYRNEINAWIRSRSSGLDAVIDFDKVMRDASNPDLMNPILDLGDHIHPNPYGYLLMGKAIDTSIFDDRDDDRDRDDD